MGAVIRSVGVAKPGLFSGGSINLTANAAKDCLQRIGQDPNGVDVLVNAGVYKERNLGEPSLASMIQCKVGANRLWTGRGTFSFDVNNGGCGMVTGIQLIDGFIKNGPTKLGLVVAGDSEPFRGLTEGFDFKPYASAMLLCAGKANEGFVMFRSRTYAKFKDAFWGRIKFAYKVKNRHTTVIKQSAGYVNACADCAMDSLTGFLKDAKLTIKDIDLVIPSQSPIGFLDKLKKKSGLGDKIIDITKELGNIHSASIGAALDNAMASGRFKKAGTILFLAVGSGITVSMALYKNTKGK